MEFIKLIENDIQNLLKKIQTYKDIDGGYLIEQNKFTKKTETTVEQNLICDICNHTFDKQKNLKRHKLRAHGEKKFECFGYVKYNDENCQAKFSEKYALERHIIKHKENGDSTANTDEI